MQETWTAEPRSQAEQLADTLGLGHVGELAPRSATPPIGGLALVSRWPILRRSQLQLPGPGRDDADRWLLVGDIDHPSGGFRAAVTHLSWRLDDGDLRRAQVDAIVTHLDDMPRLPGPTVLAGDLNAPPDADEIRLFTGRHSPGPRRLVFRDAWETKGDGDGVTWSPANPYVREEHDPPLRIDYVLVEWRPDEPGRIRSARLIGNEPVDAVWPSDHFGVCADVVVGPLT